MRAALRRDVRLRGLRARQRPVGARPRPARHQAAVRRRAPRCVTVRLHPARPGGGGRRRYHCRPGRPAPLHVLALGGAAAADHPDRGPQAAAGHRAHHLPGRRQPGPVLLEPAVHPTDRSGALGAGLAGRDPRGVADRRRAADGGRRTGWGPALRRPGLEPDRRSTGGVREFRPVHLQHRLRRRRWGARGRIRVLRPGGRSLRHQTPPDLDRRQPAGAGHRRRGGGDERAHGQPRLRRLLPAVGGGLPRGQGRAVRPGGRRGLRRLRLVPAAGGRAAHRGGLGLLPGLCRPVGRGDGRPGLAAVASRRRPERGLPAGTLRRPGGRDDAGRGVATGLARHAGGRPGQAGGQHDHGVGTGSPGALPRPRAGGDRGPLSPGAQTGGRRQGGAEGGKSRHRPGCRHRPAEGLLPGARCPALARPDARAGAGRTDFRAGAGSRALPPRGGRGAAGRPEHRTHHPGQ